MGEFPPLGGSEIFSGGREGLSGGGNLRKSDFDHSNISQSQKQLSVNIEHWLKSKISMTCVYKKYEVEIKMVQEQRLQLKMKILLGYNVKTVI